MLLKRVIYKEGNIFLRKPIFEGEYKFCNGCIYIDHSYCVATRRIRYLCEKLTPSDYQGKFRYIIVEKKIGD